MAVIKTVQEESLVALGDAIREKAGTNEPLVFPTGMIDAINNIETGGGGTEIEPIVLTGAQDYGCSNAIASKYIELFSDTISTSGIVSVNHMFYKYQNEHIPFEINMSNSYSVAFTHCFYDANKLKVLPKFNNVKVSATDFMFYQCESLRTIPEDYFDNWDWSYIDNQTSAYSGSMASMFGYCDSLRSIPEAVLEHYNPLAYQSYSLLYNGFTACYALDRVNNLPVYEKVAGWTSNALSSTCSYCNRIKSITFKTNEDGSAKTTKWKNQTFDLSLTVGYGLFPSYIIGSNSGITADKEVKDDATYQALKNDPDWFSCNIAYSRYNHDSAVETINSLPNTSAYGTNTIKFKGAAGSATDGGAINTLTEEEIAVAAAKGWTVSFV